MKTTYTLTERQLGWLFGYVFRKAAVAVSRTDAPVCWIEDRARDFEMYECSCQDLLEDGLASLGVEKRSDP
jgi:hypothetical protein